MAYDCDIDCRELDSDLCGWGSDSYEKKYIWFHRRFYLMMVG